VSAVLRLGFDSKSNRSVDADGRLHVALTNLSKAAVNEYWGREIPKSQALGLDPNKRYRLYRDPVELEKGASTFNNLPLLVTHVGVNAENPRPEMVCGSIGSDVHFDAPFLKGSLCVWTADAIARVESEATRELSCAYRYDADMVSGVTSTGESYDGVMRNIRGNHVALVEEGRAGPDVLVADSKPRSLSKMRRSNLVAALVAALPSVELLALDKAIDAAEEMEAADAELTPEERKSAEDAFMAEKSAKDGKACDSLTDEEKKEAADKAKDKKARDRKAADAKVAADKKAADKKARDEGDPSTGRAPEGGAPNPAKDAKAMDAAIKSAASAAESNAVKRVTALFEARKVVAPLVGEVAFDSAEEVYAFALKKVGVKVEGVHASAYPALVSMALDSHKAKAAKPSGNGDGIAYDSAAVSSIDKAIPGLRAIRAA